MRKIIKVKDNYYKNLRKACKENGGNYFTVKAKEFPFEHRGTTYEKVDVLKITTDIKSNKRQFLTEEGKTIEI